MEKLLEIRDLYAQYKTEDGVVYAVNGIDLDIVQGETLGLLGETGAGKTTTALSILRLLPERTGSITSGFIKINGIDITRAKEADMRALRGDVVSMIFQDPMTSLNPLIPVGEQIDEAILLHTKLSKEKRAEKVDAILESVGIPAARKNEYPHQFSGGMKQRIVIAIALSCSPQLLLADEPTTALDVTIQAQVLHMINELKKKMNMAMLLITHDLGVIAQTCDRVAVMYAGKIVERGTVRDIYDEDKKGIHHPYTMGLFGSIPSMSDNSRRLNPIPGLMPDPSIRHTGCVFYDRCKDRMDCCRNLAPSIYEDGTHQIACFQFSKRPGNGAEGSAGL